MKKILVIDDDPVIVKMFEGRLKANGYDVLISTDAADGLERAFTQSPDLILLDVMMPVINGYNFCRLVKTEPKYKHIPIIMVTSRVEESDKAIGQEVGADAYVTKPFQMDDVISHIQKLLKT